MGLCRSGVRRRDSGAYRVGGADDCAGGAVIRVKRITALEKVAEAAREYKVAMGKYDAASNAEIIPPWLYLHEARAVLFAALDELEAVGHE